jgi:peptide-methionine (S)-S-oxide reductase
MKTKLIAVNAINDLQREFAGLVITKVLSFKLFNNNSVGLLNYYYKDPLKPFCESIINPKLRLLLQKLERETIILKLQHLLL